MASVQTPNVKEWAAQSSPVVQVEGVEKGYEEDSSSSPVETEEEQPILHVHDGEKVKTSYDVEEDVQPSVHQNLRGKLLRAEDKVKPKEATQADDADPHPALSPSGPGILSDIHDSSRGTNDDAKPDPVSSKDLLPQSRPPTEVDSASQAGETKTATNELGTGYEEDSEKEASTDSSDTKLSSHDTESIFKPVQAKDASQQTLEDLRASKLNQNSSPDDVKAPGVLNRAKEEAEAVADQLKGDLTLKPKRVNSGDVKPANQGGFFTRIAESFGYGRHGRSQSQ